VVVLWANGQVIDTVSEAELGPRLLRCTERVQLKSEDGRPLGEFLPPTPAEPLVPWEPSVTEEEFQRRLAEPGYTFDELKKKLGWA
jgi:hypothetical protein